MKYHKHKNSVESYLPHQQRVVLEVNELTDKLNSLEDFFNTHVFFSLGKDEQHRLIKQSTFMELYWGVLHERINNF